MVPIIIDVVLLAILILFVLLGARRGLILSIAGLLALFIALAGAYYLARNFSPTVSAWIEPKISASLQEKFTKAATDQTDGQTGDQTGDQTGGTSSDQGGGTGGSETGGAVTAQTGENQIVLLLKKLGLYDSVAKYISGAVTERVNNAGEAVSTALAATLSQTIAFWALFFVCFVLILILVKILVRALNLVAKLPGLNLLNRLGGALFGLISGLLVLFLIAWATRFAGSLLPEETVSKTYFLRTLIEVNPIDLWPKL